MCQGVSMSQAAQLSPITAHSSLEGTLQYAGDMEMACVCRERWLHVYVECAKAGGAPCVGGPSVLHLVTSWSPVAQVTNTWPPSVSSFLTHLLILLHAYMLFQCTYSFLELASALLSYLGTKMS